MKQIEKKYGRVGALKEQDAISNDSEGTSEGNVEEGEDEGHLGPKSHVSLLDQHSDLKRKAEGR